MSPMRVHSSAMKTIPIDARSWRSPSDFYTNVLQALEAPDWHGRNLDALYDSIVTDNINGVRAPYLVIVTGIDGISAELRRLIELFASLLEEARAERGLEVYATLAPPY